MRNNLFILLVFVLIGCSTTKSSLTYEHINFTDGISNWEAKLIAQHDLVTQGKSNRFHHDQPKVFVDGQFPTKWFVRFNPKSMLDKLGDYLVVVDKLTGKVEFSGSWWPSKDSLRELLQETNQF